MTVQSARRHVPGVFWDFGDIHMLQDVCYPIAQRLALGRWQGVLRFFRRHIPQPHGIADAQPNATIPPQIHFAGKLIKRNPRLRLPVAMTIEAIFLEHRLRLGYRIYGEQSAGKPNEEQDDDPESHGLQHVAHFQERLVHGEIVLVAPGEFLFVADHARKIGELCDIAAAALELHGLRAFLVRAACLI